MFSLVFISGGIFLALQTDLISRLDIIAFNTNPLIRHFSPTWRSLKKIIDVPYVIRSVFIKSDLPVYELSLSGKDLGNLLNNLPNFPYETRLYEESKQTIKADLFRYGDYSTSEAKLRYRGKSPDHWNAIKKSWQIILPDEQPLGDRTTLRFILPSDKGWVHPLLWNHLAEKLQLLTPQSEMVRLVANEQDRGVYILWEGWEESFFEKRGRVAGPLFAERDVPPPEDSAEDDLLRPEGLDKWQNRFDETQSGDMFPPLVYLVALTANASDEEFRRHIFDIVDQPLFFRWTLANLLGGTFGQNNYENLNFYFNPATGKFEPIFFDPRMEKIEEPIDIRYHRLVNRVFRIPSFKAQFEAFARSYVHETAQLEDDLQFYDRAAKRILPEAYRDTAKLETSFEVGQAITREREAYEHNFHALASRLKTEEGLRFLYAEENYPLGDPFRESKFASFSAVHASRAEFLRDNPQFIAGTDNSQILLPSRTHTFSHSVIVPKNLSVVIHGGARLLFAPEASFISYSPVSAQGSAAKPITVTSLVPGISWGVFALMNTGGENVFRHVSFSDGKDATINGVYFSGMLSARNADLDFRLGTLSRAGADDGIHVLSGKAVIENSLFTDNFADDIDVDLAKDGSRIVSNRFRVSNKAASDQNGDGIDSSFSSLFIAENMVESCKDKGISVGEASRPLIQKNTIKNCSYGIAVKDRSEATLSDNILEGNTIAIGLYRKKPHFIEGGTALLSGNTFINNKTDITADEYSHYADVQPL